MHFPVAEYVESEGSGVFRLADPSGKVWFNFRVVVRRNISGLPIAADDICFEYGLNCARLFDLEGADHP